MNIVPNFMTIYTKCTAQSATFIISSYHFFVVVVVNFCRAADVPRINQLFPLATIRHIPGAGHWAHVDKPAEFLQLVGEFLSNCDNRTDNIQTHGHL